MNITKQVALGTAIAEMYIAAQHISMEASDAACEAIEQASIWTKWGFDKRMAQSDYGVRALPQHLRMSFKPL